MLLLFLTGVGPLLAWRKTSIESLKRNFLIPTIGGMLAVVALVIAGVKPWQSEAHFYSVTAIALCVLVTLTIASEFFRGAKVIRNHSGQNLFMAAVTLTRRNTRRYGGYIVHFGVVLVIIGFAGAAFNRDVERELGRGDSMQIGPYTLVCESYTQDDKPNYTSEWAIIHVSKNGQHVETMYPERRFYKASQQPATIVANRSTMKEDLYLVYSGLNQDTGRPIIKAQLNPLVWWIWAGVHFLLIGTIIAMLPNAQAMKLSSQPRVKVKAEAKPVGAGD